jgi:hypothetical protein
MTEALPGGPPDVSICKQHRQNHQDNRIVSSPQRAVLNKMAELVEPRHTQVIRIGDLKLKRCRLRMVFEREDQAYSRRATP